jgi:hypothetical protein
MLQLDVVIDAVCGMGKTFNMAAYVKTIEDLNILAPTFRRALALTLSDRFNMECYTGIKAGEGGMELLKWNQATVCLKSLVRIPSGVMDLEKPYDVVILDKAGMSRRFFVGELMECFGGKCLERLRIILERATTVVVMQYKLSERDVAFYTTLCGLDLYDPRIPIQTKDRLPKRYLWWSSNYSPT